MLIATAFLAALALPPGRCTPATGDADALLRRAADVIGLSRVDGRVLAIDATDIVSHDYESDRMYPPYLWQATRLHEWFDATTGADRVLPTESMVGGQQFGGTPTLGSATASFVVRDTALIPNPALHGSLKVTRPLNVWAVVADWMAAGDARVVERCEYRDYPRLVLTRRTSAGAERLYLDPKSGYPVSLQRVEPNYLWGQRQVEYVYATWLRSGAAHFPGTASRTEDGETEFTRTFGNVRLVARDSAPSLALPANAPVMTASTQTFLTPSATDTVRVSATTFIVRNPGYGEVLTLARDTVFIFDATQGDARARQDSVWIGKLFPGRHAIAVVVTDIAWPHVAGVRYWVAHGAPIISHRASQSFLERVVQRRWTQAPDVLEKKRGRGVSMHFVPADDSLSLAGGAITLFAIDGISSEGALNAYVQNDRFLWASDYVQTLSTPTQYVDEVVAAVNRMHLTPERLAAEHLRLSDWSRVVALAASAVP